MLISCTEASHFLCVYVILTLSPYRQATNGLTAAFTKRRVFTHTYMLRFIVAMLKRTYSCSHGQFTIRARTSQVLFVFYIRTCCIQEHLQDYIASVLCVTPSRRSISIGSSESSHFLSSVTALSQPRSS